MLEHQEIHRKSMIEIILDGSNEELIEVNTWISRAVLADDIDGIAWALELWKQTERLTLFFYIDEKNVQEMYMAFKLRWM